MSTQASEKLPADGEPTMLEIYKEIIATRTEINSNNKTLEALVKTTEGCLKALGQVTNRLQVAESKLEQHDLQIATLLRNERSNNIVVYNVPVVGNERSRFELAQSLVNIFREVGISLNIGDIVDCYRIGKSKTNRPVILKLVSNFTKKSILEKKDELTGKGISVKADRTPEERQFLKVAMPCIDELRRRGYTPFIKNGKIIINEVAYSVEEIRSALNTATQSSEQPVGGKRKLDEMLVSSRAKLQRFAFMKTTSAAAADPHVPSTSRQLNAAEMYTLRGISDYEPTAQVNPTTPMAEDTFTVQPEDDQLEE